MTDDEPSRSIDDRTEDDSTSRLGLRTGQLARWSATRPKRTLAGAAVVLVLSLILLSQVRITTSLAGMLGKHSPTAAAMERVTTQYAAGDTLLLLVELPPDRLSDTEGQNELIAFAERLEAALESEELLAPMALTVRYRQDPAFGGFAERVMLPNGLFYLDDDAAAELIRRLSLGSMREQFRRNSALIAAPGPAGTTLSEGVLRDPLRLLELIPPALRAASVGPQSAQGGQAGMMTRTSPSVTSPNAPEFSEDGRALLVHIGSTTIGNDYRAAGRLVDAVVRASEELNTASLRVSTGGAAAIATDASRVIRKDSIVSCLASVGLVYALFLLFYRRWSAGLLIGGVVATGIVAGMGSLSLFLSEVSPLSAMIAALLAGVGADYGIHFHSHYDNDRQQGLSPIEASTHTAERMAVPIGTNCLTSIFGFISLWPSKIQMLSDFALMGAAGLVGALAGVFVLLPASLVLIDRRETGSSAGRVRFGHFADVVAARPRVWMRSSLMIVGVAVVSAAMQGFPLRFESDLSVLHPKPSRALDTTIEVIRRFSTQGELIPVEIVAPSSETLVTLSHQAAVALSSPACREVGVEDVRGLHRLLPNPQTVGNRLALLKRVDLERTLADFDTAVEESDFSPESYSGYRDFLRTLLSARRAPDSSDVFAHPGVAARVFPLGGASPNAGKTNTVLLVQFGEPLHDRQKRREAIETLRAAAASVESSSAGASGSVTVTGTAALSTELEETARQRLPLAMLGSFVLVVVWLTIVFRRVLHVVLALVPLLFAVCTTILFIMATGQRLNPINSVAVPLLIGIAVDAGVFLVSVARAYGRSRRSLRLRLRPTTHALLLSIATTGTAFAALGLSHTPAIRSLGLVSLIGILASGVGALLLVMPILLLRAPSGRTD